MMETCINGLEIIEKAKKHVLKATNIDTNPDEMKVLDVFLFRCWQMGWLDKYTPRDDGVYMELFAVKNGMRRNVKVVSMSEASKTLTNGLMDGVEKLWS
jgi:uncharacterized protein (DUF4213/DUF364 family)